MLHEPDLETSTLISKKDQRLLLNTFLLNVNGIIIASDNFYFPRLISSSVIRPLLAMEMESLWWEGPLGTLSMDTVFCVPESISEVL